MTREEESVTDIFAFSQIPMPRRPKKPRTNGLTMMIDWGLPLGHQRDCLECQGLYVDEAKIAASIPRMMPEAYLQRKIDLYKDNGCLTFPGGLFAELALAQGTFEAFLAEAKRLSFSAIEVSDNLLDISPADKKAAIKLAVEGYGLKVMGEVGRKEGVMSGDELIADVENCLEAGAAGVLLEAHELFHGEIRTADIDALVKRVPLEKIMFELPVAVLPDVTKSYKVQILMWLVKTFGTEVNLANVEWDEVYFVEITRRGAGGDTSHPDGAYRRAGMGD